MSKGGGSTTKQELPPWLEDAAKQNLARASMVSDLGYVPYYGNDVAAFSPMQQQAMMNTGSTAQAFGMAPAGFDPMAGMPKPTTDNLGFSGYSSGDMFDQSMSQFQQRRPGQYDYMNSMFIDPQSGQMSQFNQGYIGDELINRGMDPEAARAAVSASIYSDPSDPNPSQAGMSGSAINMLRMLPNNPAAPLGILGVATNYLADQYAGDYGKEGQPGVYGDDMFYRSGGVPTPVRGSDFYSSDEAASNAARANSAKAAMDQGLQNIYSDGGEPTFSSGYSSLGVGGGNASRGFTTGGW